MTNIDDLLELRSKAYGRLIVWWWLARFAFEHGVFPHWVPTQLDPDSDERPRILVPLRLIHSLYLYLDQDGVHPVEYDEIAGIITNNERILRLIRDIRAPLIHQARVKLQLILLRKLNTALRKAVVHAQRYGWYRLPNGKPESLYECIHSRRHSPEISAVLNLLARVPHIPVAAVIV